MIFLCSPSILSLTAIITWLGFWPVLCSVWGPFMIGKQSLLLILFFLTSDLLKNRLPVFIHGILDVLLFMAMMLQSGSMLPNFIVVTYSYLLVFLGEALFVWMECVLLLSLVKKSGRLVSKIVFDYTDESTVVQVMLILVSIGLCYSSIQVMVAALRAASSSIFTHLSLLLIVIHVLNAIWSYFTADGVITNSALVFLASSVVFYLSVSCSQSVEHLDYTEPSKPSFVQLLFDLPVVTTSVAAKSLSWVRRNYGLDFFIVIFIRLAAAPLWVSQSDNSDYDETIYVDEDSGVFGRLRKLLTVQAEDKNPWMKSQEESSTRMLDKNSWMKILCVLIYSQQIMQRTGYFSFESWMTLPMFSYLRLIQSFLIALFYAESLYQSTSSNY